MKKGELQYNSRMEDIRVLKLEIRKLHRERANLNKSVSSLQELRKEIFHTQRLFSFFSRDIISIRWVDSLDLSFVLYS